MITVAASPVSSELFLGRRAVAQWERWTGTMRALAYAFVLMLLAFECCSHAALVPSARAYGKPDWECAYRVLETNVAGVPKVIEISIKNLSSQTMQMTVPNPLGGETSENPHSVVYVHLTGKSGAIERFYYATTNEVNVNETQTLKIAPMASHTKKYEMSQFYRGGPCGPDLYGSFLDYFTVGSSKLAMRVVWLPDMSANPTNEIQSAAATFLALYPDWLFKMP
jgi:hypothetical protein